MGIFSGGRFATVRNAALLPGMTVFSGDVVAVGPKGGAWLAFGRGAQLQLGAESEARMHKSGEQVQVEIVSGRAAFGASEAMPVELWLGDARIRASGAGPAAGVVVMRGPSRAVIAAERGFLSIYTEHDEKSVTLRAGEQVEITLTETQASTQTPPTKEQKKKKKRGGGFWLSGNRVAILSAVMVGGALLTLLAVGNGGLTDQQKQNLVSPFQFP